LPQKIFLPNQDGDEGKVVEDRISIKINLAQFGDFLEEKDNHHEDD